MRDIKFRGIGNGRAWEYGGYTYEQFEDADLNGHYICNQGLKYEVDGNTVGQYTGLKDKNGKEIYEGDIVKRVEYVGGNFVEYKIDTYEVVFKGCSFQYVPIEGRQFKHFTVSPITKTPNSSSNNKSFCLFGNNNSCCCLSGHCVCKYLSKLKKLITMKKSHMLLSALAFAGMASTLDRSYPISDMYTHVEDIPNYRSSRRKPSHTNQRKRRKLYRQSGHPKNKAA